MEEAEKKKDEDDGEVRFEALYFPSRTTQTELGHCLVAWKWGLEPGNEFIFNEALECPKESPIFCNRAESCGFCFRNFWNRKFSNSLFGCFVNGFVGECEFYIQDSKMKFNSCSKRSLKGVFGYLGLGWVGIGFQGFNFKSRSRFNMEFDLESNEIPWTPNSHNSIPWQKQLLFSKKIN